MTVWIVLSLVDYAFVVFPICVLMGPMFPILVNYAHRIAKVVACEASASSRLSRKLDLLIFLSHWYLKLRYQLVATL